MAFKFLNSAEHFGFVAILLHWMTALVVFALFGLGLYMTGLDYYDPWYHKAPWFHKSLGLVLFALLVFRVIWKLFNPTPAPLGSSKLETRIALVVHSMLYTFLFVIFVSGYLISSADGAPISVFDWVELPALVLGIENQEDKAGIVHLYIAWTVIVIAALHALAATKHHVIDRDDTLRRMILPK